MTIWPILPIWNGRPGGRVSRLTPSASNILAPSAGPVLLCRHRVLRRDPVKLRGHDKVVLVQTPDLFCPQRDRRVAPAKTEIGVMAFGLGQRRSALDKGKGLAKILETIGALDSRRLIDQGPVRRLLVQIFRFVFGQRRNAAAAWCAGSLGQGCCHDFTYWR